jgi:HEAT repeat protein/predicted amidohydrolase
LIYGNFGAGNLIDQSMMHEKSLSINLLQRKEAVGQLRDYFCTVSNKEEAWKDLIRLIGDKDSDISFLAAGSISKVFIEVPDKSKAWKDLHWLSQSDNINTKFNIVRIIGSLFPTIANMDEAWSDLLFLSKDSNDNISANSMDVIGRIFPLLKDKKRAWEDIIDIIINREFHSNDVIADLLCKIFREVPNKDDAWKDLIRMVQDEEFTLQIPAKIAIISAFSQLYDKSSAWNDIKSLIESKRRYLRLNGAIICVEIFAQIPEKDQAWKILVSLSKDEDNLIREIALKALKTSFELTLDRDTAWHDLIELSQSQQEDISRFSTHALLDLFSVSKNKDKAWKDLICLSNKNHVRMGRDIIESLGSAFSLVTDKEKAWNDIIHLINENDLPNKRISTETLIKAFSIIPNNKEAWNDLHFLRTSQDPHIRRKFVEAVGSLFASIPNRRQAQEDIFHLLQDDDESVKSKAVWALGLAFNKLPDKHNAWLKLIYLSKDENSAIRRIAADALASSFPQVPDKAEAWRDLLKLIKLKNEYVQWNTARAIEVAFKYVPNTEEAWSDLIRLAEDENNYIQQKAIISLGLAFGYMPDKDKAWEDLYQLSKGKYSNLRAYTYHALGRASVFKATVATNDTLMKDELNKAINFFEESVSGDGSFKPSKFCLPFYRSFYAIVFENGKFDQEILRAYLADAKDASEGSEVKEILIEAIENLSGALNEIPRLTDTDLEEIKYDLKTCKSYCDKAEKLLEASEEAAPVATSLIRRGRPIITQKIKLLVRKIQLDCDMLGEKLQGTGTKSESIFNRLKESTNKLDTIVNSDYEEELSKSFHYLKEMCGYIPLDTREEISKIIHDAEKESKTVLKIGHINTILLKFIKFVKYPKFEEIFISNCNKKLVRVAAVQIDFELELKDFPPLIKDKDRIKEKIIRALDKAQAHGVNIVCLPELCICENWLNDIKDKFPSMIIIAGSYYDNNYHNSCRIIAENPNIPPQLKIIPSEEESSPSGPCMTPGDMSIYVYISNFGRFTILICRDFINFCSHVPEDVDLIFVPSYNSNLRRFHNYADNHVINKPTYIIISNTSKFGGTSIFGLLHKKWFGDLKRRGCKSIEDDSYKICQFKEGEEGLIIADLNLEFKSISQVESARGEMISIKKIFRDPMK